MMPLGEVAPLAKTQLAAWEVIARDWPTVALKDPGTQVRMERCGSCFGGIYRLTDDHGHAYRYTDEQKLAQVVAHLRQAHMHLDPDR